MASWLRNVFLLVMSMPLQKLLSRVGLIVPVAFTALISTWAFIDQAAKWEAAITASIMISILVQQRMASVARQLQIERTPGKIKHRKPDLPPSCTANLKPSKSLADVLRDKLGVNAPSGKDFFDIFAKRTVELQKLYSWLDEIEAAPHRADREEAFLFSLLVRVSARHSDVWRLERALQCMELSCVPITLAMYTELISRLGKKGDMASAKLWFERMEIAGLKGDVQTYSSLIHGCAKLGNIEDAESWYKEMLSAGVAPTEVTFNSMVNACARCRRADLAEQWFHYMEDVGMTPTGYTFNSLIDAFTKTEQMERAEYWLMEMTRRGLRPDVVSFSTIIHTLPRQKGQSRVMLADRLMRNMLDQGFVHSRQMPVNFRCVIQVCARGREMELAEHWLNVAEKSGYKIGRYCYKFVAGAYEMLGQENDAAALRQRMDELGKRSQRQRREGPVQRPEMDQRHPVSSSEADGSDGGKRI